MFQVRRMASKLEKTFEIIIMHNYVYRWNSSIYTMKNDIKKEITLNKEGIKQYCVITEE